MDKKIRLRSLARQALVEELLSLGTIEGRKDFIEFLREIWPLDDMPSTDPRHSDASGDIWQHTVINSDWDHDELYGQYLNLYDGPVPVYHKFLENSVDPSVRKDLDEQAKYVEVINRHLSPNGLSLQISEEVSGYYIYRLAKQGKNLQKKVKNLIFAANGYKPEIVLSDSVSNDIKIVKNAEFCLIYDLPIPDTGFLVGGSSLLVEKYWVNRVNLQFFRGWSTAKIESISRFRC